MTIKVELVVDTPERIAGVEYARDLYNSNLPKPEEGSDAPVVAPLTSEEYIMFVLASAADSWATQADRAARMKQAGLV